MRLEEILNEDLICEDKLEIINEAKKNNFKDLENLSVEQINEIKDEIKKVYKEARKLFSEIEKEITSKEKEIQKIDTASYYDYEDVRSYRADIRKKDSLVREVKNLKESKSNMDKMIESTFDINSFIKDKIKDAKIDEVKSITDRVDEKRQIVEGMLNDIKAYNEIIKSNQEAIENYGAAIDTYLNVIESIPMPYNDQNEQFVEQIFNNLEQCQVELDTLKDSQEKALEQIDILNLEYKREQQELNIMENQANKQQKKEENLNQEISRFEELCEKEKLDKLEAHEFKNLYQVIYGNSQLKSTEKNDIRVKYVIAQNKFNNGNFEVKPGELKPQKENAIVSKATSVVAKGKLTTIRAMQKVFDTAKEIKEAVTNTVTNAAIGGMGKVIDFLSAKKDLLEQKQNLAQEQEKIELEAEEIEEVQQRVM